MGTDVDWNHVSALYTETTERGIAFRRTASQR